MNNPLGMLSQFLGAQNGMNPISIMTQLQKKRQSDAANSTDVW